jgi:hypothetical protein
MPLGALVLLHIVPHQHLESTVDSAVIKIKTEAADLQGFSSALVLPGVDAGIEHVEIWSSRAKRGRVKTSESRRSMPGSTGLAVITMVGLSTSIFGGSRSGAAGSASLPCWGPAARASRISVVGVFITVLRIYKS